MIESYVFLAMFTAQILAMSVLYPGWIISTYRRETAKFPVERLEALYPGYDFKKSLERHLTWLRIVSAVLVVFGVALMLWLFDYMQRPDWDVGTHRSWVFWYGIAQVMTTVLIGAHAYKYNKLAEPLREKKRKAILQRRGLFDFVSPFAVALAVVSYLLFVAYLLYLTWNDVPGLHPVIGYTRIVSITTVYLLFAVFVYRALYRRKSDPLETSATRERVIGSLVRWVVYFAIAFVAIYATRTALTVLDLPRWRPILTSTFFVLLPLLMHALSKSSPRPPEAGDAISGDIGQQLTK